jgi:hypothetical protein
MNRDVKIYYYKMRGDLSDSAITDLFESNPNSKQFVTNLFESSNSMGFEKHTRIRSMVGKDYLKINLKLIVGRQGRGQVVWCQ